MRSRSSMIMALAAAVALGASGDDISLMPRYRRPADEGWKPSPARRQPPAGAASDDPPTGRQLAAEAKRARKNAKRLADNQRPDHE